MTTATAILIFSGVYLCCFLLKEFLKRGNNRAIRANMEASAIMHQKGAQRMDADRTYLLAKAKKEFGNIPEGM